MHRDHSPTIEPRGLSRSQAAALIGVGVTLFDRLVEDGRMPRARAVYGRRVWDRREVDAAFDELPYAGEAVDVGTGTGANVWDDAEA